MRSTADLTIPEPGKHCLKGDLSFEIHPLQQVVTAGEDLPDWPRADPNFKIIWVTKGTGVHYIDFQKLVVENNSLFFVGPNQVHRFSLRGQAEGYLITFAESFLCIEDPERHSTYHSSLFNLFAGARGITLRNDLVHMKNIAEEMINEFDDQNLFRAEILRRYFKIFLIYVTRQLEGRFETIKQSRNMEVVQQFMNLLERNYKKLKKVSDYARMLSVAPNYLNEIIKKTTGFSAGHHIRQRIALEAKRQATYSNHCMKEIAYLLGFYDLAHFSKFFKNTTGVNFSDFKKERFYL